MTWSRNVISLIVARTFATDGRKSIEPKLDKKKKFLSLIKFTFINNFAFNLECSMI